MNLIEYLGTKKLNDLILPNPFESTGKIDVTKGPDRLLGMLGSEFKLSEKTALKQSNTTIGTLYGATYKLVRIQPDFGTVALTGIIVGRPLFWNDKKKFLVTPLATATALLAGIAICVLTSVNAKGDMIVVAVHGDVGVKLAAALTKAAPVANDPVILSIAASLATADVILDATGHTNVQDGLKIGRVIEPWTGGAGLVKKMYLNNAYRIPDDGIGGY